MGDPKDTRFDPPRRRESRAFEPPPWEKEAFERLGAQRAERLGKTADVDQERQAGGEGDSTPERTSGAAQPSGEVSERLEDPAIEEMLSRLKDEEPKTVAGAWKAGVMAGAFLVVLGLVFIVWASVALAATLRAGPAGWMGSGIVSLMGIGLVALGVWLGGRSLRNQGVL
ncbi:MAG: hypothetical protein KGZ40_03635 [Clostridiales bacterium]|nr:hypothetical protein [Clostridiales bacterium]